MKAYTYLPEGYMEKFQINLQKDPATAKKVNIGGGIVMAVMILGGNFHIPITKLYGDGSLSDVMLRLGVLILGYIAYIVLHELTHAAVMKAVGGKEVKFGFTGLYAFAGSSVDYFDKIAYRCIALAPLILWGIIFGILTLVLPGSWFWVVWFLQAGNIGGAAGDVYVTARLWKEPSTILIRDTGVDATVFDK
jgi:hypothetical protein